jgi:hypothetical protein
MRRLPIEPLPWLAVLGSLLLGMGVVAARPVGVDAERLRSTIEQQLGGELGIGSVAWHWLPTPVVELRDLRHRRPLAIAGTLELRAGSVDLYPSAGEGSGASGEAHIDGLQADLGPLRLVRGHARLVARDGGGRLEARALGRLGGWLDATAERTPRGAQSLSLYLADLAVPFEIPSDVESPRNVQLDGTLTLEGSDRSSERLRVDLGARALHHEARESWLEASLQGELVRHAGRWLDGSRLAVRASLRDLDGERDLRAIHGETRGTLALSGDATSPRFAAVLDLRELRLRWGDLLDKPAGRGARIEINGRWRDGGAERVQAELSAGAYRLWAASEDGERWTLRSSWISLDVLREHVPLVRRLPSALSARARLSARIGPDGEPVGRLELRDVQLVLGDRRVRLETGLLRFESGAWRLEAPGVQLGPEQVDLHIEYAPSDTAGPLRVRLSGRASSLDLVEVARVLEPLLGTPRENPSLEDVLTPVVGHLRARPRLLDRLHVDASALRVDQLRGLGLDVDDALIRFDLSNRRLHLACEGTSLDGVPSERSVIVVIDGWAPSVRSDG